MISDLSQQALTPANTADVRVSELPLRQPLPFTESRIGPWLVAFADIVALELAVALGYGVRLLLTEWFPASLPASTVSSIAAGVLVLPLVYFLVGLYPGYRLPAVELLRRRVFATVGVFALMIAWDYLVQNGQWSRAMLLTTFFFVLILPPVFEAVARGFLIKRGLWGRPVILIGAGELGTKVAHGMKRQSELGLVPTGFLDDDPGKWGRVIDGVPVLGPVAAARVCSGSARVGVLCVSALQGPQLSELRASLPYPNVIAVTHFMGIQSLSLRPRDLGGIIGLELNNGSISLRQRLLKQTLDMVLAGALFVATLPLMGLIALAIKLDSNGPVFFAQERLGRNKMPFKALKFRTMAVGAEDILMALLESDPALRREYEVHHKLENDPRVTRVGRFLRLSSLDELPQLINVLRGEMSLVGPRPYLPRELPAMESAEDVILEVAPGISGLWQVSGRATTSFKERLQTDVYYVRNWSLWLDLHILFRTVNTVMCREGAR